MKNTTIERCPTNAEIERQAKTSADLALTLGKKNLHEFVEHLALMNGMLRRQMQEQSSLMHPICISGTREKN